MRREITTANPADARKLPRRASCANCQHWEPPTDTHIETRRGVCEIITDLGSNLPSEARLYSAASAILATHADFYCALHDPTADEPNAAEPIPFPLKEARGD